MNAITDIKEVNELRALSLNLLINTVIQLKKMKTGNSPH